MTAIYNDPMSEDRQTSPNSDKPRVLIVDDDYDFAEVLSMAFQRKGYVSESAHSVAEAVKMLELAQYDYATLDLRMPGPSGLTLIQTLTEKCPGIRIVVITGYAGINTAVEAIKLGATHYLAKPVSIDEIIAALTTYQPNPNEPVNKVPNTVGMLEWERIQQALKENEFNISATARQLGMHRRTLQRKLQKKHYRD